MICTVPSANCREPAALGHTRTLQCVSSGELREEAAVKKGLVGGRGNRGVCPQ